MQGFVGGADFDCNFVDFVLAKNAGKDVNVLIDSLGGNHTTALAEQMFSANNLRITYESQPDDVDFDALRPILIIDFTCEMADLPEKPNSVKFTWRYATNRPTLTNPIAGDIFTNAYNFSFK